MASPRLQFRFGLKTLFAIVTLAAVAAYGGHYLILRTQAKDSALKYLQGRAALDAGAMTVNELLDRSAKLLDAELRLPFADRVS